MSRDAGALVPLMAEFGRAVRSGRNGEAVDALREAGLDDDQAARLVDDAISSREAARAG